MWAEWVELELSWGARGKAYGGAAAWDMAEWDNPDDVWSGVDPIWQPIPPCQIAGFTLTRGRSKATERFDAGNVNVTLTARDDQQAAMWSWLRTQPTVGDELLIRARLLGGGQWWNLIRGTIRDLKDQFDVNGVLTVGVSATDALADLAAVNLPEQPTQGGGERTDQRIARILDAAEFPLERAKLDVGVVTCASTNLARNLLDEAQVTAESEIGDLWCDPAGFIVFRNRQWWLTDPRTTEPLVSFANTGNPDHCPAVFDTAYDLADLENQISMAREGGTAITVRDSASVSRYGLRTHQRFDLVCQTDAQVADVANFRLAENRQRTRRIDQLAVFPEAATRDGAGDPMAAWRTVLDRQLGDACLVEWLAGGATEPVSQLMHIQGWSHTIDATGRWSTVFSVWDRADFTPVAGWDIARWNTDVWAAA